MKSVTKQQKSTTPLFAFFLAFCIAAPLQAQMAPIGSQTFPDTIESKQQPTYGGAPAGQPIPGQYIVVLKKNAATESLKSKAPAERKKLMRELAVAAMKRNNLPAVNVEKVYGTALSGFSVSGLSEADAEKLRQDAQVDFVEQDQVISLSDDPFSGTNEKNKISDPVKSFTTMPPSPACAVLTVNGQAYQNGFATFGATQYAVTGELVLVDDGTVPTSDACQPVQNNVSGKIALIDRSICLFGDQALQAQNAGAIAVIIANNVAGPAPTMDPDPYASYITIPVISISQADGNTIKMALNNGPATATIDNQYTVQCTPWGVTRVGGGLSGAGKRAWIIDTGIDLTHPDLNVNTTLSTHFAGPGPQDENGSGTHKAGIIAAKDNSFGVIGVAAGAEVVAVRIFDSNDNTTVSWCVSGVDYAAAHAAAGDVINVSLSAVGFFSSNSTVLNNAIVAASSVCPIVLSAVNGTTTSPVQVNGSNIFTVSAMDHNDNFVSFSCFGNPPIDFCEPGTYIPSCHLNAGYKVISDTDLAGPHLSGLILLGGICSTSFVNGDPDGIPDKIGVHDTGNSPDNDGDGYTACDECNDNNAGIFPGATEICDGIDNNCDGIIDNGNVCCDGGTILYVKADATGLNTGTSWTNAYTDLQSALQSTCPNVTEIWVAAGTYKPAPGLDRNKYFSMKNGLAIYGGFPGLPGQEGVAGVRDWTTNITILSGDLKGDDGPDFTARSDNSTQVVYSFGLNNSAILDGVIIYGGGSSNTDLSSGMINSASSPTLSNVTFISNTGSYGGMLINGGHPVISNCRFEGNKGGVTGGGGIYMLAGNATISGCSFADNQGGNGGAINFFNPFSSSPPPNGTYPPPCTLIISNSNFERNVALNSNNGGSGGAIYIAGSTQNVITVTNCRFYDNRALSTASLSGGGHIMVIWEQIEITNCTFSKGYATSKGGSILLRGQTVSSGGPDLPATINARNIISAHNSAGGGFPNFYLFDNASGTMTNCLLDDGCPAGITCNASLLNTDPLFVNVNNGNLTLNSCSPAIDAGTSAGAPAFDIVGAPRFEAIPGGGIVDIGAYELQEMFGNVDNDLDGWTVCAGDCNDSNPAINPGATEVCDGVDNNCDGIIDENNVCCSGGIKVYVNAAATGLNDGTSWVNAFTSLQTALGTSCVNEIWVAAGTYRPATYGNRTVSFVLKNGIAIYGGFPNTGNPGMADRNWLTHKTILSGDLLQNDLQKPIATQANSNSNTFDNSYTVVIGSGTNTTAVLDGFFITAGTADGILSFPGVKTIGGGMYIDGGTPTINNCSFSGNLAYEGGGLYALNSSTLNMTGCQFTGNVAGNSGGGAFSQTMSVFNLTDCSFIDNASANGGGVFISASSGFNLTGCSFTGNRAANGNGGGINNQSNAVSSLTNCVFTGNRASADGGGMRNSGQNLTLNGCNFTGNLSNSKAAGLSIVNSSPVILNCNFIDNVSAIWGGGITNEQGGNPTVSNCLFQGNRAQIGGGLYNTGASCQMTNCSFIGNAINGEGAGAGMVNFQSAATTVTNTVFRNNFVSHPNGGGAAVANQFASPNLVNCTFYGNAAANGGVLINLDPGDNPTLTNCILFGNTTTNGESIANFNSSTSTLNYTLLQEGACPAGSNCGAGMIYNQDPLFVSTTDLQLEPCSPVLDKGDDAANATLTDRNGNSRKFDAIPGGSLIDMGAYERQTPAFNGNILYVNDDATGLNKGTSWADAFTSLQSALNCPAAAQIWVAAGTYKPTTGTDRTAGFVLKNGVAVYGGFSGIETGLSQRSWLSNPTILSGDIGAAGNGDNSYHVIFNSNNGLDSTAILDGFTITGGQANGGGPNENGGGMYNLNASPKVLNCTFTGNAAGLGGGVYNSNASPKFVNCKFLTNTGTASAGGMYNDYASTSLTNCQFTSNSAAFTGGGMFNNFSSTNSTNCAFTGNSAGTWGGGVYNNQSTNAKFTNCSFSGNAAASPGGGMCNQFSSVTVTNCSFSGNAASDGGGMYNFTQSSPTVKNCIIWNNTNSIVNESGSNPFVTYSIVEYGYSGTGNLNLDPLFILQPPIGLGTTGNLRLQAASPAIDAGTGSGAPPFDLDGHPRPFGPGHDMGAHEFGIPCPEGNILFVKADATGANNGTSWADAFTSLQSALASTCPGITQIWVAAGTYQPTTGIDRTITFAMRNDLAIYGGFAGTETMLSQRNWTVNASILSGDIGVAGDPADNSYSVVLSGTGLGPSARLDGLTVTGAAGGGFSGGIYVESSLPTIANCLITGNASNYVGGGLASVGSFPLVSNCTFSANSAASFGGGLANVFGGSPSVTNCLFINNTCPVFGGGGGLYSQDASMTLTNCTFSGNSGQALHCNTAIEVSNCIFWGNGFEVYNATAGINNSIVQNGYAPCTNCPTGNGNSDPLFVSNTDLRPQACSPAIDAGEDSANLTPTDLAGNARKFDAIPGGQVIDLGAFEFQSSVSAANTWTGNGDGLLWSDPANWSNGFVPGRCQDVVVPSGTVMVPSGFHAVGKTLDVATGALLEAAPAATVDIKND